MKAPHPSTALAAVLDRTQSTGGERFTLVMLATCVSFNGETGPVRVSDLAEWTGQHRSTVIRHLNTLEESGEITRVEYPGRANGYRLPLLGEGSQNATPPDHINSGKAAPGAGLEGVSQNATGRTGYISTYRDIDKETDSLPTKRAHDKSAPAPGWDEFWALYPKKVGRLAAIKAWNKIRPDEKLRREIMDGLTAEMKARATAASRSEFFAAPCHASTWLNGERWLDEHERDQGITDKEIAAKYGEAWV